MSELTHKVLVAPGFLPTEEEWEKRDKDAGPLGEELANLLAAALEARGWHVEYRWTTYEGHAFDARRKEQRYDVELTSLDTSTTLSKEGPRPRELWQGRWVLTAKRRSGLFFRFWSKRYDADEHALLRLHLDEALAGEAKVAAAGEWWAEADFSTSV